MMHRDQESGIRDQESGIRGRLACAVAVAAISLGLFGQLVTAQESKPWEKIPVPPLHAFNPHQPKRIELKNGIVIFLQEDHELPFISGSVLIPGDRKSVV